MKRILVTGATGTIGVELVPRLVQKGWQAVCLVRGQDGMTPEARLEATFGHRQRLIVPLAGNLLEPFLGLDAATLRRHRGSYDAAIHCAASTSFDDAGAAEIWAANRDGARHFSEAVLRLGISRVHAISTAYVAGDAPRFAETDLDVGQRGRNAYEESKKAAEEILRTVFGDRLLVYRPSIVVGSSRTSRIRSFEGFYRCARAVQRIAAHLTVAPSLPAGIGREAEAREVPLTLCGNARGRLNLVPIDWVVDTLVALIDEAPTGHCCHLTHASPIALAELLEAVSRHFGVTGIVLGWERPTGQSPRYRALQRALDAAMRSYRPYLAHDTIFGHGAAARLLGRAYSPPPLVDGAMIRRLLDYAVGVGWRPLPAGRAVSGARPVAAG